MMVYGLDHCIFITLIKSVFLLIFVMASMSASAFQRHSKSFRDGSPDLVGQLGKLTVGNTQNSHLAGLALGQKEVCGLKCDSCLFAGFFCKYFRRFPLNSNISDTQQDALRVLTLSIPWEYKSIQKEENTRTCLTFKM